jgi:hypothetical protein
METLVEQTKEMVNATVIQNVTRMENTIETGAARGHAIG